MSERTKLLFHSNAPWSPTGYGNQTALTAQRLKDHYDLAISAFYGLEGNILPWNSIPVMPGIGQSHGNQTIHEHARVHFGGLRNGIVLTLMDVWVLDPSVWREVNTCSWVPVDHDPAPPPVAGFFEAANAIPIAMSRFGAEKLSNLDPLYVPHAVDTSVYKPVAKDEAREATQLPQEAFIVGMVAANKGNPSRKCFSEAFQAFKVLRDRHSEALLYLHTEATGRFDGVDLLDLADAVGLDRSALYFADQYRAVHFPFPHDRMAEVFSSIDVLLMPSAGEGFGIPAIEAQACGVPVIASDFSAQPELSASKWLVSGHRFFTPLRSWQFHPEVESIVAWLEQAYSLSDEDRNAESLKAITLASEYDVEKVMAEHMLPALAEVEQRFSDREPMKIEAREPVAVAA